MEYSIGAYPGYGNVGAVEFQRALWKGQWEFFIQGILERACRLTLFEVVKNNLNLVARQEKGRKEIRLDQITGSVGKHQLFTRSLRPLSPSLENRWVNVYELMLGPRGYPPIEVYQVRDQFFILDGHHRASVARSMGNQTIEAHVIEWPVLPT